MVSKRLNFTSESDDAELVAGSLAGDREAFAQIVTRYQSLVCSIAYSATGSLSESEDIAQETFLSVWKQLSTLREPAKLRSWLCQIARNRICDAFRKPGRELIAAAAPLEVAEQTEDSEPMPVDKAISREEEAILWRSLENIPESYREPLILFYREGQSIERVARGLDLSQDTVKQRLSRGRKLLAEQVNAFVEGALQQSAPRGAFTLGVLAMLPGATLSASAATAGAVAAQGSAAAKASAATGLFGTIIAPILFLFGTYIGYRANLDSSTSDLQRAFVRKSFRLLLACLLSFAAILTPLLIFSKPLLASNPTLYAGSLIGLGTIYTLAILLLTFWTRQEHRKLLLLEQGKTSVAAGPSKRFIEYRSQRRFLGLPLYHIRLGGSLAETHRSVKAWIAVGDTACGAFFAFGGVAIAPIATGGLAIGLFSFGGSSLGLLALGGFAAGYWACGGMAIGMESFAACALGWHAAVGGVALAREVAIGGAAYAAEVNNGIGWQVVRSNLFFRAGMALLPYFAWMNLLWILPLIAWWRALSKKPASSRV